MNPSPLQDVKTLTGTAARTMVQACLDFARKNNLQVTVVVVDSHADILELHRMDGAHLQAFRTAQVRAQAALFNRISTKTLEERVAHGNRAAARQHPFERCITSCAHMPFSATLVHSYEDSSERRLHHGAIDVPATGEKAAA